MARDSNFVELLAASGRPSASDEKQQPFAGEKAKQLRQALQNGENELTYDVGHVRASSLASYIGSIILISNS
jgi:hypothetical protein